MVEHLSLLARVTMFEGLEKDELQALATCFRPRRYFKDAVVVHKDDPGNALFIIAEGRVKVVLSGDSGREIILTVFREGDFFGEMSLLDGQPRSATVVAMDDARLLVLERETFVAHMNEHPTTALNILAELSRRLRRADEIIGDLALLDVYGRLGRLLRELAVRQGNHQPEGIVIAPRPTHQELASMIGTTRETVSRIMRDFKRQGLLVVEGRSLILSPQILHDDISEQLEVE